MVAKIISLFVEKTDFFLWNICFLVERKCYTKNFLQKEMIFGRAIFFVSWKTFAEKDF